MQSQLNAPQRSKSALIPIMTATVGILAVLAVMAPLPAGDQLITFIIGVIILLALMIGLGLMGWHLLVRPLPANIKEIPQPIVTTRARHIAALTLTLGLLSIGLAGVWDEIWHVRYGIPFGEDFFWRPHLLLYFGFLSMVAVGGWAWWTMMRKGTGTLQQRFRANPILGVSALAGLFTTYAVGADPLWHKLYGRDLAPWSVPHLLLIILIITIGMMAIAYHKSVMPVREWKITPKLHWRDVLISALIAGGLMDFLVILTIEWYGARTSEQLLQRLMARPEWMLGIFMTFVAAFFGVAVLHATRRVGTATLTAVIAVVLRYFLQEALGRAVDGSLTVRDGIPSYVVLIPLFMSLDIFYAIVIRRTGKAPSYWMAGLFLTAAFGVVGLPLIGNQFVYPPITLTTIPGLVIAGAIGAVIGVWLGQLLGDTGGYNHDPVPSEAPMPAWVNAALYAGFVLFFIYFVVTAVPPVAGG